MSLRGRPPTAGSPERKSLAVYCLPRTHLLVRLLAEQQDTTIGRLVDGLIAVEAERHGISLGST